MSSYPVQRSGRRGTWGKHGTAILRDAPPIHVRSHLMDLGNYSKLYLSQRDFGTPADCAWCDKDGSVISYTLVGRIIAANSIHFDGTALDEATLNVAPLIE